MSTLYVAEFQRIGETARGRSQLVQAPSIAEQKVTFTGTPGTSAAFNVKTTMIRVHVDGIAVVAIGDAVTAATTGGIRMVAGQTEYFAVLPGHVCSAITTT